MLDYQQEFLEFAIKRKVIEFGQFTLKSGRVSPYFFNAGLFNSGDAISKLGRFYAETIVRSGLEIETLFGPAYKGVPLVTATAIALFEQHRIDLPWCFNRKEAKDHGEGGNIVGAQLWGRTLIVDDVITAGTAVRESMQLIGNRSASAAGIIVALDRQERGNTERSAIQEVQMTYNIPVISIVTLDHLLSFSENSASTKKYAEAIRNYRDKHCAG